MPDAKIERAEARLSQQRAEYEEWLRQPCYRGLPSAELIALAKNSRRLTSEQLEALDGAWFERFGERLTDVAEKPASAEAPTPDPETEQAEDRNLDELEDDDLMTRHEVARKLNVTLSTVQNMEEDGRLPKPIYIGSMRRHLARSVREAIAKGLFRQAPTKR